MHIEEWNQVHDIVVSSSEAVLTSVGLAVRYVGTVSHREAKWAEILALIGLGGKLRGSLVLSVPTSLVKRSHPAGATEPDDLNDWLAELVNLLLGRVKSRLLTHGVTIELSTPLTISATAFRFERFSGTPVVHEFDVEGETLHVVFEAVAEPELRLTPARAAAALEPGELITF